MSTHGDRRARWRGGRVRTAARDHVRRHALALVLAAATLGSGDGPTADALTPRPTDLTGGTADVPELMRAIDGRRTIRAHGSAAMPVWGAVFEQAALDEPHARRTALLHVQALAEHTRTLQAARR
jgi:hypothetical protein